MRGTDRWAILTRLWRRESRRPEPGHWTLQRRLAWAFVVVAAVLVAGSVAAAMAFLRLRNTVEELIGPATGEQRQTVEESLWLLALLGAGTLVTAASCGIALWVTLGRLVTQPLVALQRETHQVMQGKLDHPVTGSGPEEIVALAREVDAMRRYLVAALLTALSVQEALREQAAQLEAQADDLRRSNAELEQFAYVASHDLQEPLRKVASFCQLLERRYSGQLDERGEQYLVFAADGAKRMQRLINDLLAFSRVGRTTGEFTEVDLNDALDRALVSLSAAIEQSDAEVEADPLPTVSGNPTLLTQVFQNLIGNAIKFAGPEPPRVRITLDRSGDEWVFSCIDNGIGIEPQYAERIFVIFQRLHTKEEYDGTGIGLAMCRKILEHHGGRIWLEIPTGQGTTVRWTLPAMPSAPGGDGAEAASRTVSATAAPADAAPSAVGAAVAPSAGHAATGGPTAPSSEGER